MAIISQQQLADDLRGEFRGELFVDLPRRSLYATDASPFEILPHAVAIPHDDADLRSLVRYAYENQLPLMPRGAGTGLSGESLGSGIMVDCSVHFRAPPSISSETITAQVGWTLAELNRLLLPHNRRLPLNPASQETCTLGGMIATNASGSNVLRHGTMRDILRELQVIWDNGEQDRLTGPANQSRAGSSERYLELRGQVSGLLSAERGLIQLTRSESRVNRCGYILHDVLPEAGLNLARLLVGTEGTLSLHTEATLATSPLPGGSAQTLLGFASLTDALRGGVMLQNLPSVTVCDLLDQRLIAVYSRLDSARWISIPREIAAVLIVEVEADTQAEAEQLISLATQRAFQSAPGMVLVSPDPADRARQWIEGFRARALAELYSLGSGARPVPFIEDVGIPPEQLLRYVGGVSEILRKHRLSASFLIHVLAGIVHARPLIDLARIEEREKMWPVAEAVHELALKLGGTVSAQHGTGITRTPWVEKQYGPLMTLFRELKRIFDPRGILNPGKLIGPDPSRPAWPLRATTLPSSDDAVSRVPLLLWKEPPVVESAKCHGCGDCRTRKSSARMCPAFQATGREESTPRAQANLLRALFSRREEFSSPDADAISRACTNCKMCLDECPAGVAIPALVFEARAAHLAEHGMERDDWMLARLDLFSRLGSRLSFFTNRLLKRRKIRWVLEKALGLARARQLPAFTSEPFLKRARRSGYGEHRPVTDRPRVAYFVDLFANYCDPSIGEATVRVLEALKVDVHVPLRQRSCGMAPIVVGDLDHAQELAEANVRLLANLIREGYTIVCSEPTAVVAIKQDYPTFLDHPDLPIVIENTFELTEYLSSRLATLDQPLANRSPALPTLRIAHHVPCHVRALGTVCGPELLAAVPGFEVTVLDQACSGMAGTHGLRARSFDASLKTGQPMLEQFARPEMEVGATECSACRLQMQQAGQKRVFHPVQYLAWAWGLMPQLERRLKAPLHPLVSD
jgi:FAD/FMN-containing dehydrogenase/Fe-S oxidoreductase